MNNLKNHNFDYKKIEKIIGYSFKNKELLKTAFTHSSFANENNCKSNERLEFLGDSVLGFIVTKKLYNDYKLSEGELSKFRQKLVSEQPLAFIIEELGLADFLLKGKGESKNKFDSKAIKADLFEALVGAMLLDSSVEQVESFILSKLHSVFEKFSSSLDFEDSKTKLQEKLVGSKIIYNTKKIDHKGYFEYSCELKINGVVAGCGSGHNKKQAEMQAATEALSKITKV